MADPVAIWGAVTGSIATGIATRREYLAGRKRLRVAPGCNYNISREDDPRVTHAWAFVAVWNIGGRALSVERAGFRYAVSDPPEEGVETVWEYRAEITFDGAIELPVDGPTRKIYTPVGPLLAAGVNPVVPIQAFAVTTGGRWWYAPPQMLISEPPPGISLEAFGESIAAISDASSVPPSADRLIWLAHEEPFLPEA